MGPDVKSQLIGKDLDAGKDWGQEKRVTENEMVGMHLWLSGYDFEQTLGDSEGQESLVCCILWGCKKSETTERLDSNISELSIIFKIYEQMETIQDMYFE